MGWFATAEALKHGTGPYGTVRESLRGECDPGRTVRVALAQIQQEIADGRFTPDRPAKIRLRWWARRAGVTIQMKPPHEAGQATVVLAVALFIIVIIICAISGNAVILAPDGSLSIGQPERLAEATLKAASGPATATAAAVSLDATATTAAVSLNATATAVAQSVQATQTAMPYSAARAGADAHTSIAQEWIGVAALGGGLVLCGLMGLAAVAWLRTQARIVRPTASGQMPMMWDGHTLIEPNRMVGAAATTPDWLTSLARLVHLARTGQAPQQPQPMFADGGADADHLLHAAQTANAVSATVAIFRPDNAEAGRRAKIELLKRGSPNVMGMLGNPVPTVPNTRIIVSGDSAIEAIARQLGDQLPRLTGPATFNADQDDDTMKE